MLLLLLWVKIKVSKIVKNGFIHLNKMFLKSLFCPQIKSYTLHNGHDTKNCWYWHLTGRDWSTPLSDLLDTGCLSSSSYTSHVLGFVIIKQTFGWQLQTAGLVDREENDENKCICRVWILPAFSYFSSIVEICNVFQNCK